VPKRKKKKFTAPVVEAAEVDVIARWQASIAAAVDSARKLAKLRLDELLIVGYREQIIRPQLDPELYAARAQLLEDDLHVLRCAHAFVSDLGAFLLCHVCAATPSEQRLTGKAPTSDNHCPNCGARVEKVGE
jgi:hypothetical protein